MSAFQVWSRGLGGLLGAAARALWLAGLLAVGAIGAASAAPPPADVFFREPGFDAPKLSPDGMAVGMVVRSGDGRRQLAVLDLATLKPAVVASFASEDIADFAWVNERRLVFWLRVRPVGPGIIAAGPGLFGVDKDGERYRQLVETDPAFIERPDAGIPMLPWRFSLLQALPDSGSDDVLVAAPEEVSSTRVGHVVVRRLNTVRGRSEDLDLPPDAERWVFDARGQVQAITARRGDSVRLLLRDTGSGWRELGRGSSLDAPPPVPLAMDGPNRLLVGAGHGRTQAVFAIDLPQGQQAEQPLLSSADFDLWPSMVVRDGRVRGLRVQIDAEVMHWLQDEDRALQARIDERLKDTTNLVTLPRRGDSPWVLVESHSDVRPMAAYAFEIRSGRWVRLGQALSGLEPAQLGRMQFARVTARDGRAIPTYLTLPPGPRTGPAPTVVWVHGGPWARGLGWRFDPEVQFLAARGYAVLQPEFRGSTGFGADHFRAGWGQWGLAMQDDLVDALRWAVDQGHADPKRVCIGGASYGGYAALMALVREPERFRCGISVVGVTDPSLLFSVHWSDLTREVKSLGMKRLIGDPETQAEHFRQISPVHQAARIRAPVMLAYGGWDLRVPLIHGERMRDALKAAGVELSWQLYPEEGHGWSRAETRIDHARRLEAFLAKHLGAARAP